MNADAGRNCGDLHGYFLRIRTKIRFIQDQDWLRSAFPYRAQVAFQSTSAKVLIEGRHCQHGIDVRDKDLFIASEPCRLSREPGSPREYCANRTVSLL